MPYMSTKAFANYLKEHDISMYEIVQDWDNKFMTLEEHLLMLVRTLEDHCETLTNDQ